MRWAGLTTFALLVMASHASASSVEGTLYLRGPVTLSGEVHLGASNASAFLDPTADIEAFEVRAAHVDVERFRQRFVEAPLLVTTLGAPAEREEARYSLSNVTIRLYGSDHAGWLGIYAMEGPISLGPSSQVALEARDRATIGNTHMPEAEPDPGLHTFGQARQTPTAFIETAGRLEASGDITIKVKGLDIALVATENETRLSTGTTREMGARDERWVVLRLHEVSLAIQSPAPIVLLADEGHATWIGELRASAGSGQLASARGSYTPAAAAVRIEGDLRGTFAPTRTSAGVALVIPIAGDLEATTLASQRIAAAPGSASAVTWIALGVVAVLGGAALVSRRRAALAPDELVQLGRLASEAGRHEEALAWFERARRRVPSSATLVSEIAFSTAQCGRIDDALVLYDEAAKLSPDGQADLDAFRLLRDLGLGSEPRALRHAVSALTRSPELVVEMEDMGELPDDPSLREAIRQAARAIDRS